MRLLELVASTAKANTRTQNTESPLVSRTAARFSLNTKICNCIGLAQEHPSVYVSDSLSSRTTSCSSKFVGHNQHHKLISTSRLTHQLAYCERFVKELFRFKTQCIKPSVVDAGLTEQWTCKNACCTSRRAHPPV